MPGYLDQYGAGEEERNRLIIRSIVAVVVVVVVTALGWYLLKNHHQESVVKTFLGDVRRGDYQAAYRDWGCTSAKPCSDYTFDKFNGRLGQGRKGFRARPRHSRPHRQRILQHRRAVDRRRERLTPGKTMGG